MSLGLELSARWLADTPGGLARSTSSRDGDVYSRSRLCGALAINLPAGREVLVDEVVDALPVRGALVFCLMPPECAWANVANMLPRPVPPVRAGAPAQRAASPARVSQMCDAKRYGACMTTPDPPPMRHRSWYLRADVAERLDAAVNEMHFTTRRPKHEVLGAAVAVLLEHQGDILARLTAAGAE